MLSKISVSEQAGALPPCTVSNVYCTEQNDKRKDRTAGAFHVYLLLLGAVGFDKVPGKDALLPILLLWIAAGVGAL